MSLDFYQHLADALQQGAVVLATVIDTVGSVPREVGAKMMVWAGGRTFSTIGGGAGEAKVIEQARVILATGEKQAVEIDLTGATHRETQGICGGRMRVWLERWQGDGAIALAQKMVDQLKSGQSIPLVTPFVQTRSPYIAASVPAPLSEAFIEIIQPPPLLLIVGAGHVGEQLAIAAHLAGFQIAIQDERPDWANSQRYPQATVIFTEPIQGVIAQLTNHHELYVALVTRGYQYDLNALQAVVQREPTCSYIGMIGSQKRVRQVLQTAAKSGISESALQTLYAPIGLDIGALTPAEIAISIVAELIMVRRQGSSRSLSQDQGCA